MISKFTKLSKAKGAQRGFGITELVLVRTMDRDEPMTFFYLGPRTVRLHTTRWFDPYCSCEAVTRTYHGDRLLAVWVYEGNLYH